MMVPTLQRVLRAPHLLRRGLSTQVGQEGTVPGRMGLSDAISSGTTASTGTTFTESLPNGRLRVVEPHTHFNATGEAFHSPLKAAGLGEYVAADFAAEVAAMRRDGIDLTKAVHMECMPTDPLAEAEYVEAVIAAGSESAEADAPFRAIVASCDLSAPDAADRLDVIQERCPSVVGIRYVVDYDGPFTTCTGGTGKEEAPPSPKTHFFVSRHGPDGSYDDHGGLAGVDFLRDPSLASQFEAGFGALAERGLTFDLQCAPEQLEAAAAMVGRHPGVKVVVDHLGKPRFSSTGDDGGDGGGDGGGDEAGAADAAELQVWREGMDQMAALPNVYVKLSMLGYAVPGWAATATTAGDTAGGGGGDDESEGELDGGGAGAAREAAREARVLVDLGFEHKWRVPAALVLETIDRFGPERCMFSTNWYANGRSGVCGVWGGVWVGGVWGGFAVVSACLCASLRVFGCLSFSLSFSPSLSLSLSHSHTLSLTHTHTLTHTLTHTHTHTHTHTQTHARARGTGSLANSDGRDDVDISMSELWQRYHGFVRVLQRQVIYYIYTGLLFCL